MRFVLQRVSAASVTVDNTITGAIDEGIMLLAGFGSEDTDALAGSATWNKMLDKVLGLRIFTDDKGKLNLSLNDTGGGLLLVSQFTLYADCRKGRRPSFAGSACPPDRAETLYARLVEDFRQRSSGPVASGIFGADMDVALTNSGPVTIVLDSEDFS